MKRNQSIAMIFAVLLFCTLYSPALAYLKSSDGPLENLLSSSSVRTEVVEEFDPDDAKNMVPGQEVQKVAKLKNTGTTDEFLVMKVRFVGGDDAASVALKADYLTLLDLNAGNDWVLVEDGDAHLIYYYQDPVAPEGFTSALFTGVRASSEWKEMYDFDIMLSGAAIQSEGIIMSSEIALSLFEE